MTPRIVVVAGYLAAGKSTFARRLSKAAGVPRLIKDTFKSALCASVSISGRSDGRRFSAVTFDAIMYVAERLIETGYPVIIEGNFVPHGVKKTDEAGAIRALIDKYMCRSLTYKFVGDTKVLHERFIKRDILPERGRANMMFYEMPYCEFDTWCHALDAFDIGGEVIEIDTTNFNLVDFERHIKTARKFLL
ncbi:MAG: AAA family ATPase [Clostridiales bacterium]|nr:AAA family ATPase [Clostridiales bacterium]